MKSTRSTLQLELLLHGLGPESGNRQSFDTVINKAMALIKQGADLSVNDDTRDKWTLFHWLVYHNEEGAYDEQMNTLLNIRPSLINDVDGLGRTPLFNLLDSFFVFCRGKLPYIKKLVQLGARIDSVCPNLAGDECSLLHLACLWGNKEIAEYLIDQKLDINARTPIARNTPLIMAVAKENIEMIKFLINRGADISLVDIYGRTARDFLSCWDKWCRVTDSDLRKRDALLVFDAAVEEKRCSSELPAVPSASGIPAQFDKAGGLSKFTTCNTFNEQHLSHAELNNENIVQSHITKGRI